MASGMVLCAIKRWIRKTRQAGLIPLSICLSGCGPTARHPGPLGGFGDFLQDTPGAVFVLALVIWFISNRKKK